MTEQRTNESMCGSDAPVLVERRGHVLLIGVNRPHKRNAWDLATIDAVGAAYQELGNDPDLRAGVVPGVGQHCLVQAVVPPGEQLAEALRIAELIAAQAPLGVQATLANSRVARDEGPAAAIEHLRALLPGVMASQDAAEGLRSFVERRTAQFQGR